MYSFKDDWGLLSRVSPFRHLRINVYLPLPAAFRSLSRLSSALSAKASTLRSCSLNHDVCEANIAEHHRCFNDDVSWAILFASSTSLIRLAWRIKVWCLSCCVYNNFEFFRIRLVCSRMSLSFRILRKNNRYFFCFVLNFQGSLLYICKTHFCVITITRLHGSLPLPSQ